MAKNKVARVLSVPVSVLIILAVYFFGVPNPMMVLIIPVALFTYLDGYFSGILSGCTVAAYSAYYFFIATRDKTAGTKLLTVIFAVTVITVLIGRLKAGGNQAVTQPEQTHKRIMEEEKRVKLMLDATPLICTLWDKDFKIFDCNDEAVRMFRVQDKREVRKRFYEFSPEFQPDGRRSEELVVEYVRKAYEEGKCVFEWLHQAKDGTLFPAEVTLIRVGMQASGYTVVGYARDLSERKQRTAELEKRGRLLDTINQVAGIILLPDNGRFNDNILRCMGMIGTAVDADRVTLWKNHIRDGKLYCSQIHEWLGSGEQRVDAELMTDVSYDDRLPGWEETLSRGDCVSSLVRDMEPEARAQLSPKGILSIFLTPVFVHDKFWGYLGFDNCHEERTHTETEQYILRSGSLLLAHAFVRYEMNQNIRETTARLQSVVENYPGIVFCVDSPGRMALLDGILIDKLGEFGMTPDRIIGKILDELPPDLMPPELNGYIRKTFAEGEQEWILKTELGAFHVHISPIYGNDGEMTGVVGSADEITEIIRLQDDLKAALDKANEANDLKNTAINSLENILNSIDVMIYATVPETGELLFVNDYMQKHLGKTNGELIGKYCYKILHGADQMCDFCPYYRLKEEPEARIVWENYEALRGKHVHHSDCLIDWPGGKKVHLQCAVDITELVEAREAAEQSNRAKGVFIAQMSHEVRTPMNAILGISEIQLRDRRLPAGAEEGFREIYNSGNLLLNIINDILDFSKIDAGKMEIVPNKYDIPSLVNDTVQLCRLRYESKPIDFNLRVDENTPLEMVGDELRIRQILNNLLSNAFKYTDAGEVRLSVASELGRNDGTVTLILRVSDTGQGMTKEQTDRIFDEYLRFNMEKNYGIPGAGLGMNITKRLVDMMGGEILVESEVGRGSAFTVRLPQKDCGSVMCGADIVESLRNFSFSNATITKRAQIIHEYMPYGKVLVVDDVESNLYVAKGLMIPYGLRIETAKSGFEAIEKIKNGEVYDIVFMDHMMPVMDGIKAAEILRGSGYNHPIVALTANAITGQSEMFLSNGFDRFISKPVDSRELDIVLTDLIRDKQPPEILEAARREREKAVNGTNKELSELDRYFIKDAENMIGVVERIYAKLGDLGDTDAASYTTAVHGIKSALKNIGETKLSEIAVRLEKAGRAGDLKVIADETPVFINKLKLLIEKIKPKEINGAAEASHDDMLYLREKLSEFKTACEAFSIRAAKTVLNDLKQITWPREIDDAINELSVTLLHGEFKKAVSDAEGIETKSAAALQGD